MSIDPEGYLRANTIRIWAASEDSPLAASSLRSSGIMAFHEVGNFLTLQPEENDPAPTFYIERTAL